MSGPGFWSGNGQAAPPLPIRFGDDAAIPPANDATVVRGIAHKGSLTLVYGKPKSGKSFLATDLALAVADRSQTEWMGQRIKANGPVLYAACEGHGGYWKRLQAARTVIPPDFGLLCGRPALIRSGDDRGYTWVPHPDEILAALQTVDRATGAYPLLVVIDTVFRSFGAGNVNNSSDMMAYVNAAQQIADLGCAVVLVHHATKASNSPSGSVALIGAADTLVLVEKTKAESGNEHCWQIEEAKDDAESPPRKFSLVVVDGILNADGDVVSSCRVEDLGTADQPAEKHKGRPPKPRGDAALRILHNMIKTAGNDIDGPDGETVRAAPALTFRQRFYAQIVPDESQDTKSKAFRRWIKTHLDDGIIAAFNDHLWPLEETRT